MATINNPSDPATGISKLGLSCLALDSTGQWHSGIVKVL